MSEEVVHPVFAENEQAAFEEAWAVVRRQTPGALVREAGGMVSFHRGRIAVAFTVADLPGLESVVVMLRSLAGR
jgi:hypothetical protein